VCGDCMVVWCIPSATHMPHVLRSENKVLGISLLPYFCRLPYILIEATTELNKLLVHIMIRVMKILRL